MSLGVYQLDFQFSPIKVIENYQCRISKVWRIQCQIPLRYCRNAVWLCMLYIRYTQKYESKLLSLRL